MSDYKRITCDPLGRLGNQMFGIATILSLAKDHNIDCVFPNIFDTKKYGDYKHIFHTLDSSGYFNDFTNTYKEPSFNYHPLPIIDNCIYTGYFQCEKYFVHNRDLIINSFTLPKYINDYIVVRYAQYLSKSTVSLHVRRGDYVQLSDYHPVLDLAYYNKAINHIDQRTNIDYYMIFSDDIVWCKTHMLAHTPEKVIFIENEPDYIDLILMSQCTHNIIANSSFSWWGAWLNKNDNKIVIAPKIWFGLKRNLSDKDIVPQNWIRL